MRQGGEFAALLIRLQMVLARRQIDAAASSFQAEVSVMDIRAMAATWLRVLPDLLDQPLGLIAQAGQAWLDWAGAWQNAWTGAGDTITDRRFRDPAWGADPVARGLRDSHMALERASENLLRLLPDGRSETLRAGFYCRQFFSALSPSNFLMLNPAARAKWDETNGRSLIDGFRNLVEDLERGQGRLDIATHDPAAFVIGKDLAATPGKVIYENALMQLIHYAPLTKEQYRRPLLFVPPWINKYYILDLRPENSLVRYMLEKGHSVFLISWVNPDEDHADMGFEDYMKLGPLAALSAMEEATGETRFDVLGFCIGGILVMMMLALMAARGDRRVASATTLATMVDLTDSGEIGAFIDRERLEILRSNLGAKGYLESRHLREIFSLIRENDLIWSFHVSNYLMGRKPAAFDLLFWNADGTRLPHKMLLWYLEHIYIKNGLGVPGQIILDGTPIDLSRITVPVFVLAMKEDHIAPWGSVYPAVHLLGGPVCFVLGGSGHVSGVVNPPRDRQKYGFWRRDDFPKYPLDWLSGAKEHPGSWWPEWAAWLAARQNMPRGPAYHPCFAGRHAIEDAPGRYVLER